MADCLICGKWTPVDHGPYSGEEAFLCSDCWDELDPKEREWTSQEKTGWLARLLERAKEVLMG